MLASGGYPPLAKCIAGFLAVAFASCAVNVFNDFTDRERDKLIWPSRPIPSGRVRPAEALTVSVIAAAISLTLTWLFFTPAAFFILLGAAALGVIYSVFLRDRVGYLALPPIVGLIYLGGWAAFSPETLNTWLPWYLYLLGAAWQAAHIMVYYPLHLKAGLKAPPAFFFRPAPATAVKIGAALAVLTLILSAGLVFLAPSLNALYLALVIAAGAYALFQAGRFLKNTGDNRLGIKAFTSLSVFRMVISVAVLLTVFLARWR